MLRGYSPFPSRVSRICSTRNVVAVDCGALMFVVVGDFGDHWSTRGGFLRVKPSSQPLVHLRHVGALLPMGAVLVRFEEVLADADLNVRC